MATQQQEESLLKIPIFCEWVFEKNLPIKSGKESSLYNYVEEQSMYLQAPDYHLPGYSGITYFLSSYMEEADRLDIEFHVEMDYQKYQFDADFTCTVTDSEPKHFLHSFDDTTDDDIITDFLICSCLPEDCNGCSICVDKKIVIRVEGTITVKYIDSFEFKINVDDAVSKMPYEERENTKDFVIVAENQEIRVHKSVLAENSTVFARMLDCDNWKETMENKITIPDFSFKIVEFAMDAIYGSYLLSSSTDKEKYFMVYQFADMYDMKIIIEALKNNIAFTPFNVVEYANFFFQNSVIEFVNSSIDYILSCSQYSISIKDIEMLDAQIRTMSFDRMFASPVLKKNPKLEHRCFNSEK